jgi:CDP-diacylglycerol--serine O-phosphatidyltransferase
VGILGAAALVTCVTGVGSSAFDLAPGLVGAAAVLDAIDGPLARKAGGPTRHGILMDRAADLVAFALAPLAIAAYASPAPGPPALVWLASVVLVAASARRLSRPTRFDMRAGRGTWFAGLPMPAVAGLFLAVAWALPRAATSAIDSFALPLSSPSADAAAFASGLFVLAGAAGASALALSNRPYPTLGAARRSAQLPTLALAVGTATALAWDVRLALIWLGVGYAAWPWAVRGWGSAFGGASIAQSRSS